MSKPARNDAEDWKMVANMIQAMSGIIQDSNSGNTSQVAILSRTLELHSTMGATLDSMRPKNLVECTEANKPNITPEYAASKLRLDLDKTLHVLDTTGEGAAARNSTVRSVLQDIITQCTVVLRADRDQIVLRKAFRNSHGDSCRVEFEISIDGSGALDYINDTTGYKYDFYHLGDGSLRHSLSGDAFKSVAYVEQYANTHR
jgi:hypothetical protein